MQESEGINGERQTNKHSHTHIPLTTFGVLLVSQTQHNI